mgnify:CR=1 FL=1
MAVIEKKSVSNKSSKVADKEKRKEVNYSDDDSYGSSFIDEDDSYDEESIGSDDTLSDEESSSSQDDDYETPLTRSKSKNTKKTKKSSKNKKNKKLGKKSKKQDSDEETDEEEIIPIKHKDVQRIIADIFKSKYMDKKIEELEKSEKKKKHKKYISEEESSNEGDADDEDDEEESEEQEEESDDSDDEDYDENAEEEEGNTISIILMGDDNAAAAEDYDEEDDKYDCNSDDEKMFMKENYQKIDLPPQFLKRKNQKPKKKAESDEEDITFINEQVEKEYIDLVEMKRDLTKKLQKKPKDRMLMKIIRDYDKEIKKLVKKNRIRNAKTYHKLIHKDNKNTNEIEYFKTKLSNKEQVKVMKDLKEINKHIHIDKPYRLALLEAQIPPKFKAIAMQKLNTLKNMEPGDPEYYKMKYWVDAFMRIPFSKYNGLSIDMTDGIDKCHEYMLNAKQTLDACVYGLNDAKLQIMQMLGQWISNPQSVGTAIAIKGPMGTGKTTLVKEGISKILGREFSFIALGGNSDASFLEGHSYTYEGSSWGKIVQILLESKCMNPVIYFDELDKISDTAKGEEIVGILTHLTDTSQNSEFHDKYFSDVSFDLSKCLFIFSYNDESKVNPILRDRMYRIQTKGYEMKEKLIIARKHLLPKIREQVNFTEEEVIIPDETIQHIVSSDGLTQKEDGVRNLKRCLEIIYTKLNLFRLIKNDDNIFKDDIQIKVEFPFTVTKEHVDTLIKNNDKFNPSLFGLYI